MRDVIPAAADLTPLRCLPPVQLVEVLRADQSMRWRAGDPVRAEAYFEAFPQLLDSPEDALVLLTGEILLALECGPSPTPADFRARFPRFADALDVQFQLQRALAPEEATLPPAVLAPRPRSQSGEELAALLRKRLLFIALLTAGFVGFVLLSAVVPTVLGGTPLSPFSWCLAGGLLFLLVLMAGLVGLLASRRPLGFRVLRAVEALLYGLVLAYLSARAAWAMLDAPYPLEHIRRLAEVPSSARLASWLLHCLCSNATCPFVIVIVGYGILIPNTWRRCAAVVAGMALIPALLWAWAGQAGGAPPRMWGQVLLTQLVPLMGCAAAVAVYGSHRIEVLRQGAREARKFGQYRLVRRLGAGGMGEVYLAEHVLLRRPCAVKLIRPERAGDPHTFARFEREVRATVALSHPNTVQVYDYGHADDGTFYYVMEYLPGLSLQEMVERDGPLPPERVVCLLRQVCGALAEAHAAGLTHRDVTPGNILVCERGGVHDLAKLLDFGLVRGPLMGGEGGKLTLKGAIAGTPAFMSPEQAAGLEGLDGRSDLYSLGAVAYFLLAGRPPFVREAAVEVMAAHLREGASPPPGPEDLQAVVLRCLEKDPARRFADAGALEQALARCGRAGTRERAER